MKLTEKEIEDALSWYGYYCIEVHKTDFNTEGALSVICGDGFYLELSVDEISYRAQLWNEIDHES